MITAKSAIRPKTKAVTSRSKTKAAACESSSAIVAPAPGPAAAEAPKRRISSLLRDILTDNPDVEEFTIGSIIAAIGPERPEASLVLLSVPHVVPVPGAPSFCGLTAASVGGHFVTRSKTLHLPKAVLQKKVPRRSLAVAIHAMLPILEFAEKSVQPRLAWASHPVCRRIIGVLVFILAATIAFPLIGFDPLHAISIFMMSIGMAEQDGIAILLGAGIGILSLVIVAGTALKLHRKVGNWVKSLARRLGMAGIAKFLESRGWKKLASVLRFDWKELLLLWNPERAEARKRARAKAEAPAQPQAEPVAPAAERNRRPARARRPAATGPKVAMAGSTRLAAAS